MPKKKYNVVLSEEVKQFRMLLPDKEKKKFDAILLNMKDNPLKDAKPVSNALMGVLGILEEMGINMLTMKMTKAQKKEFHARAAKQFGEDWKQQIKNAAKELKS